MKKHTTRLALVGAAAVATGVLGLSLAPEALAYGPSYCNSSSCILSAGPSTGQEYFELPRGAAESMICWTDNQVFAGTNRWFKISTVYGTGYTIATEVSNQTSVGHC